MSYTTYMYIKSALVYYYLYISRLLPKQWIYDSEAIIYIGFCKKYTTVCTLRVQSLKSQFAYFHVALLLLYLSNGYMTVETLDYIRKSWGFILFKILFKQENVPRKSFASTPALAL